MFYIDGRWTHPHGANRIDVVTPSTEAVFTSSPAANKADVDDAVAAARAAFDAGPWPKMSPGERGALLSRIHRAICERADEVANIATSEIGALLSRGKSMAERSAEGFRFYGGLADEFDFEEWHPADPGQIRLLVREPVGVAALIIPWNAPLLTIAYKMAPALLAGCTVIVKASPEAPGQAFLVAQICDELGVPPGVVNVIMADRAVSEYLVRHPNVDKVSFTGSSAAGKRVASLCGERLARVTLELGGKSAALILDDYDVATAARSLASSAIANCGQICASLTRILVSHDRHDALVEALVAELSRVVIGDPFAAETQMGPMATNSQLQRVLKYIEIGQSEGAIVATGGKRPAALDRGYFIEPTVFAGANNAMTIAREEIFGPVLTVIPVHDEAEAISVANDSSFGLNGCVFTQDAGRAYSVARQIRTGTMGHNGQKVDFGVAFGGFKQSGIGREGGRDGLMPFLETKTILLESAPVDLTGTPHTGVSAYARTERKPT